MVSYNPKDESWFLKLSPSGTPDDVGREPNQQPNEPAPRPSSVKRWRILLRAMWENRSAIFFFILFMSLGFTVSNGGSFFFFAGAYFGMAICGVILVYEQERLKLLRKEILKCLAEEE